MNNKEFTQRLSAEIKTSVSDTRKMLDSLIDELSIALENGEAVHLSNLGVFETKKRKERIIVNPSTKQRLLVPPKIVVNFKPVSSIKDKLKRKGGLSND